MFLVLPGQPMSTLFDDNPTRLVHVRILNRMTLRSVFYSATITHHDKTGFKVKHDKTNRDYGYLSAIVITNKKDHGWLEERWSVNFINTH